VYTLRDLVRMTLHLMGKRRLLIPVPFAVAEIQARLFELLPNPPLTTGQIEQGGQHREGRFRVSGSSISNRKRLGGSSDRLRDLVVVVDCLLQKSSRA
jgi:hypothetical protein